MQRDTKKQQKIWKISKNFINNLIVLANNPPFVSIFITALYDISLLDLPNARKTRSQRITRYVAYKKKWWHKRKWLQN